MHRLVTIFAAVPRHRGELLDLDLRGLDHGRPFFDFGLVMRGKRLRRLLGVCWAQSAGPLDGRWHDQPIQVLSREIAAIAEEDAPCQRLMTVPGIGPVISNATAGAIGMRESLLRRAARPHWCRETTLQVYKLTSILPIWKPQHWANR